MITKDQTGKEEFKNFLWILIEGHIDNKLNSDWPKVKNSTNPEVVIFFLDLEKEVLERYRTKYHLITMVVFLMLIPQAYQKHGWQVTPSQRDRGDGDESCLIFT